MAEPGGIEALRHRLLLLAESAGLGAEVRQATLRDTLDPFVESRLHRSPEGVEVRVWIADGHDIIEECGRATDPLLIGHERDRCAALVKSRYAERLIRRADGEGT